MSISDMMVITAISVTTTVVEVLICSVFVEHFNNKIASLDERIERLETKNE